MNRKLQTLLATLVIASVLLVACGAPAASPTAAATNAPAPTAEPTADPFSPLNVEGDVLSAGSSTVFPLSERIAERFRDEGFVGNVTVDSVGTGAGFERFCKAGDVDIANASRAIKQEEADNCALIGREPLAFRVGTDALAIVVSADNTFLTDVTFEQLALIYSTATFWSDVDPSWPHDPIERFSPGTDSGTFDYFVEVIFAKDEAPILASEGTQFSEDDNVLVQGVEGSVNAIGYFGYAYYAENQGNLKILSVKGVTPSQTTVDDNTYPLSRPLYLYSTAEILNNKPQVAAFIHFYLSFVNEEITDVGYFPAPDTALQESWDTFNTALGIQ